MTTYRVTLDRIVDGEEAVLLLEEEDDGEVVDELVVDVDALPSTGRSEGAVFDVTVVEDEFEGATYLPEETDRRRQNAQDRLDSLSTPLRDRDRDDSGST